MLCPGQDVLARTLRPVSDVLVRTSWPGHLCPIVLPPFRTFSNDMNGKQCFYKVFVSNLGKEIQFSPITC